MGSTGTGWADRLCRFRLAPLFNRNMVAILTVPGRRSGRMLSVPVAVLDHGGERYLIAPFGDTDWSRNLRVAGSGRLRHQGREEEVTAAEAKLRGASRSGRPSDVPPRTAGMRPVAAVRQAHQASAPLTAVAAPPSRARSTTARRAVVSDTRGPAH